MTCCLQSFPIRHEDGTVRFWDASGVCLHLLYKLSTVRVFLTDVDPNDNMNPLGEDEWPPLRKVRRRNLLRLNNLSLECFEVWCS